MQFMLLVFAIIASLSAVVYSKNTDVFIDNGRDQTTVDELSSAEKVRIEKEILMLLGVPRRPKNVRDPLKKSAPNYLLDVYQSFVAKEDVEDRIRVKRSAVIYLSKEEQLCVVESDTIITMEMNKVTSLGHKLGKVLWFKVMQPTFDSLLSAQLKIYKSYANLKSEYRIEVSVEEKQELILVSHVNVTGDYDGWLSVNVTSCFSNWMTSSNSKARIYITAYSSENSTQSSNLEKLGVSFKLNDETTPFVVAFLKAVNFINSRNVGETKWRVKKSFNKPMDSWNTQESETWRRCRVHTWYISFRDLKWHDWVIAPQGFDAHFCSGECLFPLREKTNATNHALVQNMMHILYPSMYRRPCCAPTELVPISVLYLLNDYSVILKKYSSMSVEGCGCQ